MWIPSTSPLAVRASPITPVDKSTAITIATWILLITFVVMFFSREVVKFVVLRKFGGDDVLILLATIFGVALSILTLTLAAEGLGVLGPLTVRRANILMKGYYASDFLYILSLCFAKLSLVAYFYNIVVQRAQRRVVLGIGIFILVWTSASLIAIAFQCKLPSPWAKMTLNCYNSGLFWIVYCILDMTTDVAIIMLSINLVAYVKVKLSRKIIAVACFAPRLLVIGAALARLVYLFPVTPRDNPAFNLWVPTICTQVQVCLSISTACIPYMKLFFEGEEARADRLDELRRKGLTSHDFNILPESGYTSLKTHKKGKEGYSIDSTVANSLLKYERTPDVSPRIPTPTPMSPLITPRWATPASSKASSRNPSLKRNHSLRVNIPPPVPVVPRIPSTVEVTSPTPQTASSHALSPEYLSPLSPISPISPEPLLSLPRFSIIRGLTPPPFSHSPQPVVPSPPHSSNTIPESSPNPIPQSPRSPSFSLFPSPASGRYSTLPQTHPIGTLQSRMSAERLSATSPQPRQPKSKSPSPPRRTNAQRSSTSPRKFAVSPTPSKPTPSATIPGHHATRSPPSQSIGSSPSIPSYYLKTPPNTRLPSPKYPRPQQRNKRILSPRNSSRQEHTSPMSPMSFFRDDILMTVEPPRTDTHWRFEEIPLVRDIRSSPRIVVRPST